MLRQGAQHALSLCAEACWLAPSTMSWMHCSTPCWLVQYCQCADWRAGCASPCVARAAREARLSVNPAAHGRRGGKLLDRLRASLRRKCPSICFAFARVLRQLSVFIADELYLAVSLWASRCCVFSYSRRVVAWGGGDGAYSRITSSEEGAFRS